MPSKGVVIHDTLYREIPEWFDNPSLPCKSDPALFFPNNAEIYKQRRAIAICQQCSYRTRCAEYAINNSEPFGIWGATTARERVRLRRARNIQLQAV